MVDERTCSTCGEKSERIGPGKQFTLPVVGVERAGSAETHSIGRGVAVDVYRCSKCRRIELYESGSGEVTIRL